MPLTIETVRKAAENLKGHVQRTPTIASGALTDLTGAENVFLKLETLQRTGSFKERGALNKILSLTPEERKRGVITASAGNHAQGVAFHSRRLGIHATIVMPMLTPNVKVQNVKKFGAEVVLFGNVFDEAKEQAYKLAAERGLVMVHPYDDEVVMAGQGTIGLEMLEDHPEIDTILLAVGGGGLGAGVATAAKAINPKIKVIGIQVERFPWLTVALKNAPPPKQVGPSTLADGIAVKVGGEHTTPYLKKLLDDVIVVDEIEVENAIFAMSQGAHVVSEGAGAVGLAAMMADTTGRFKGHNVGLIVSGANVDPLVLSEIIERGLAKQERLTRLSVIMSDKPGQLAACCSVIGQMGANIVEIEHQRTFTHLPMRTTRLDAIVETQDEAHVKRIIEALDKSGFKAIDTTANDVTL